MKITIKNVTIYLLGLLIIGFGVIIMKKAHLGMGSWDAVNDSLSALLNIDLGTSSWIVNIAMMLFVLIYTKELKHLLVIATILLGGFSIKFWDLIVLESFLINGLFFRIISTTLGLLIIPFGLSLVIHSTLPKGIFDEATYSLMKIFKIKSFGIMRIFYELFAVGLAVVIGIIAGIGIGEIGVATIVLAITIGPLIDFYLKVYKHKKKA